ncbi:hypothetical protein R6Q59_022934 [Mikania micrantha]
MGLRGSGGFSSRVSSWGGCGGSWMSRGPMPQNIYAKSLVLTSPTFTAAFTNLIPPFTFIIAVLFRSEKVEIGKIAGKAKVIGTIVGVGGAMILTFYKGHQLNIGSTHLNLLHGGHGHVAPTHKTSTHDQIFGSLLALLYSLSIALYYILQGKLSMDYPCHYSNTFLYSVIGFIQSFIYAIITEKSWSEWKLSFNIRLFLAIFQGICTLLLVFLIMAAVHLQGPLFVSIFNPLVLVFVAIAGFLMLDEKLYVGRFEVRPSGGMDGLGVGWRNGFNGPTTTMLKLGHAVYTGKETKDVNGASKATPSTTLEALSIAPTSFSINVNEGDELPANSCDGENHKEQKIMRQN